MKKLAVFALILLFVSGLSGQIPDKSELKEYFLDAEFFFAQEEYIDALYDYLELYNNGFETNANINYRMGICYLNIPGQKEKSISYLTFATGNTSSKYKAGSFKETRAPLDAWLFLGNAYRVNNKLDSAITVYGKYKTLTKSSGEIEYANQQITACDLAKKFMADPLPVRETNLGSHVNTSSSNYKAVVSGNGRVLVYMNELPFYDAVYFSTYQNNAWSEPINITPQIQSDGDQYVSDVSYDGLTLYLTREGNFDSDILISHFENDKWSKSLPLGGNINTKYWESHASVSKNGKTLYFASNRKGGPGSMDIYVSRLNALGQWGEPVALGETINTALNEDTPFITDNDSMLYFSSQGHNSMGGYDMFRSVLLTSGQWSKPENLGYPINSTDNDLFYYPWDNGKIGYMSLFEKDNFGKEDIYAIQLQSDKPYNEALAELITAETPAAISETTALREEKVLSDTLVKPTESLAVTETAQAEKQEITKEPSDAEKLAETIIQEQPVTTEVKPAEKADSVSMAGKLFKETRQAVVKEIELSPVYFTFDNFQLSETGKEVLKELAACMQSLPECSLKLYGYADALGSASYNITLSEKRAVTAFKYMTGLGIDAKRLTAVGLGETNFAAINKNPDGSDNPEGRRLNRRVEFEIFGIDAGKILIKRPVIPENLRYKSN
jgi:outer membrane protein OmpA-like peptidoglycan-associated protein